MPQSALAKIPEKIEFQGDDVHLVELDRKPWVVMKTALENIGLDSWSQISKLRKRSWARTRQVPVRDSAGRTQPTWVCDIRTFMFLLATIDENQVAAHVRPKLIEYQAEVADVIEAYWTAGGLAQNPARKYSVLWDLETRRAIQAAGVFPATVYYKTYVEQGVYEALKRGLRKRYVVGTTSGSHYVDQNGKRKYLHQFYSELGIEQNKILQGKIIAAREILGADSQEYQDYLNKIVSKAISS